MITALIHLLIFAAVVVLIALIVRYIVKAILAALSIGVSGQMVDIIIGLIAFLIILNRALPLLESQM